MTGADTRLHSTRRMIKISVAIVGVIVLAVGSFLFGFIVNRKQIPPYHLLVSTYYRLMQNDRAVGAREWLVGEERPPDGGWHTRADEVDDLSPTQREEMRALAALGYVSGTHERDVESGITVYEVGEAFDGLNLYSSGHGPEARLLTMDGTVIHRWRRPFKAAFPDVPIHPNDERPDFWRKVHVYPNGDLLAIFEALGIIKVDKDSRLIWASHISSHHDLWVDDDDGEIYVLTRTAKMIPEVDDLHPILEDFIVVLGPDGAERRRYSILDAVRSSAYSSLMGYVDVQGDIFHTNTLEILDGRHRSLAPAFAAGNALISMPNINTIAVVDLEVNRVTWALSGMFEFQHDPTFLDNGNLLVFDNLSRRPYSRVLELDARTQEIAWKYGGDERQPFFSELIGTNQRLPNGNTLITESAQGRAFEVTPEGDIVWEFRSPHSAGENDELVAVLPEMRRLDPDFGQDWLTR